MGQKKSLVSHKGWTKEGCQRLDKGGLSKVGQRRAVKGWTKEGCQRLDKGGLSKVGQRRAVKAGMKEELNQLLRWNKRDLNQP